MNRNAIAVFCADENDVKATFDYWVNVVGYTLVSTTQVYSSAAHFTRDDTGNYGSSPFTPHGQNKFVLVFEGN